MTEKEITEAVARGHGRAILFLREQANQGYADLVVRLCSRYRGAEWYTDGRSDYLCRLVDTLPDPAALAEPLGRHLFKARRLCDRSQLRRILSHLRGAGSDVARRYLNRDFKRFRLSESHQEDAASMLGVEGVELFLAYEKRFDDLRMVCAYDRFARELGEDVTVELFERLAPRRLGAIRSWDPPKRPDEDLSAAQAIERVKQGKVVSPLLFAKVATSEDWDEMARLGLTTRDIKVLRRVRRLFSCHPFPFEVDRSFVQASEEPDPDLRFYRLRLFEKCRSEVIREWALSRLTGEDSWIAFSLIRANAREEDLPVLSRALTKLRTNKDKLHSAAMDLSETGLRLTDRMLQTIYEHGPCAFCRNKIVQELHKRGALTREQILECCEDANEETREFAAGLGVEG